MEREARVVESRGFGMPSGAGVLRRVRSPKGRRASLVRCAPFLAAVFSALSAAAAAPQERAEARVDASRIGVEDQLVLTVSIPEARGAAPELPPLDGFEVLGSQRVSKTSIVNGRLTRAREWVYRLRPLATGDLVIPEIPVPGYLPTPEIRVSVESGSLRPARRPRTPFASPFGSLFDPFDPQPAPDPVVGIAEDDLFVRTEVEDSEVLVGEQALVLYRLWSRVPIAIAAPVESAQPEGFWIEEVTLPDVPWAERGLSRQQIQRRRALPGPRRERRTWNGIAYDTWPLLMRAVFPTGAGERELPGPHFEIAVEGPRASFFGPRQVVVARKAPPVTIRAAPLPQAGRPSGFAGSVGDYQLRAAVLQGGAPLGERAAAAGEPIVLRLELEGAGNLRAAGTPALPDSPSFQRAFRFFDPDTSIETGLVDEGAAVSFGGRRIWEFPMVPESGGVRNIGPLTLDVFNPRTGAYESLASDPLSVRVEGAAGAGRSASSGFGPSAFERLDDDIRYLKPMGPAVPAPGPWRPGGFFLLSLTLPLLWNLGVFAALRRRDYRTAHEAAFRRKGAARAVRKKLSRVRGEGSEAAAAVGEALSEYAAARLGGSSRGLTPEGAAARWEHAGAAPETARRFRNLLSRTEGARFAAGLGGDGGSGTLGRPAAEALELVLVLEEQLSSRGGPG